MDHSIDTQLAGWLHWNSCDEWLSVQVEASDKWGSSGISIRTSIFSSNMDTEIECTVSKFGDDANFHGQTHCRERMRSRGILTVLTSGHVHSSWSLSRPIAKCWHLGWGSPKYEHSPGRECIQSSHEEKCSSVPVPQAIITAVWIPDWKSGMDLTWERCKDQVREKIKRAACGEPENLTLGAKSVQKRLGLHGHHCNGETKALQERQEEEMIYVQEHFEWMELCLGVDKKPSGNLQVRIKDKKGTNDIIMGVCYKTPNQK